MSGTKIYVGNLPKELSEREFDDLKAELEDMFSKFGRVIKTWVAQKPAGFAFIEMEDSRDAEDAVKELDGKNSWTVQISKARERGGRRGGYGGGGYGDRRGGYDDRRGRSPPRYDRYDRYGPGPPGPDRGGYGGYGGGGGPDRGGYGGYGGGGPDRGGYGGDRGGFRGGGPDRGDYGRDRDRDRDRRGNDYRGGDRVDRSPPRGPREPRGEPRGEVHRDRSPPPRHASPPRGRSRSPPAPPARDN